MYNAEAGEVSVLGAERAVDDVYIINELRSEALELTEIALTVSLRALILLNIIDKDLEATIDSAVIEIETESSDLNRLTAAFVLACIDSRGKCVKDLVIAM